MPHSNRILSVNLGHQAYQPVWDLQKEIQQALIVQKRTPIEKQPVVQLDDVLLFVEHPHVYTLGKSGDEHHLLANEDFLKQINATFIKIDRGGDITYHGPGQIVGYPILDLDRHFTDIHKYLRSLEEVIIRTCADYGIKAGRSEGMTGVWIEDRKICAMGVKCSRWVTMHGFALNVRTDLSYFGHIVPCGIQDKAVTSLEAELDITPDMGEVQAVIRSHFADIFDTEIYTEPELPAAYGHTITL